jgi:hypothetical protein
MTLKVLTPIYPPHIKPVRDGWYLTRHFGGPLVWALVEWNEFSWVCPIKDRRITQHRHWRGLAFDPDAAIKAELNKTITPLVWEEWPGVFLLGAALE